MQSAAEILSGLGAALAMGSVIGAERQWRHRTAGLKTNALVAVGAAGFVLMGGGGTSGDAVARISAQIVSGIGFLGAGVIMRDGLNVRGLNTAATLWCSAACGTLAGAGQFLLAFALASLILTINLGFQPVVRFIAGLPQRRGAENAACSITLRCRSGSAAEIRGLLSAALERSHAIVDSSRTARLDGEESEIVLRLRRAGGHAPSIDGLLAPLLARADVAAAEWRMEESAE